jgi:hypothetical protein
VGAALRACKLRSQSRKHSPLEPGKLRSQSRKHSPLEPGVSARRWIGRLRLHAGKYILGITAPTGTGVQALPPGDALASSFDSSYIGNMLQRVRNSRGRSLNAPAAFIHPCQPIVAKQPPSGSGWAHELKHDGYRLQIHVRDGRVRLYTINGADWSKRYPLIIQDAARIEGSAILDAEVLAWHRWRGGLRT